MQRKHPTDEIREEDLLESLQSAELDALQVRGVWVLAGTGTESHDKFRKTLPGCLFLEIDDISRLMKEVWSKHEEIHLSIHIYICII